MGLRFSLQNANSVGHFVQGNVFSFLHEFTTLKEHSESMLDFLEALVNHPEKDFFTSPVYWRQLRQDFYYLRDRWQEMRQKLYKLQNLEANERAYMYDRELLDYLGLISNLLAGCQTKTLLLPGFDDSRLNEILNDADFLRFLVGIHPGDSALILQLKEKLDKERTSVFNVFSKFETAYNNIDQWPGVLLWDDTDSVFVPAENERDVINIFEILRYERKPFRYLKDIALRSKQTKKYAYLFHLSDLHFGCNTSNQRKLRLTTILSKQRSDINGANVAIPLVTGDLMDTPSVANKNAYLEFCEILKGNGFHTPIQLLGNHDVDSGGFLKSKSKQKTLIAALSGPSSVETLPDLGLGFVKFNSNAGGQLAQGKIGTDQLMNVGNELDSRKDDDKLTYIALVHHHPKAIENPEWYQNNWIEKLLGKITFEKTMKMIDADQFLAWLKARGISLVLHGHKHIPIVHTQDEIVIVAAGSATGKIKHVDPNKTYLSYNLIKYDIDEKKPVSCNILAEEILGGGTRNVLLHRF